MNDKDFQKNVETRLDIWDHLATIFFYTVIHWDFVYIMHGRGLPIFWKVYMYIYWIFCDFIALRYQTWFISFDQDFHEYYEKAHILLIIIHIILVGLLLTLALFLHHTTTVRKDGQTPADPAQARGKRPASSRWCCSCYSCRGRSIVDQTI